PHDGPPLLTTYNPAGAPVRAMRLPPLTAGAGAAWRRGSTMTEAEWQSCSDPDQMLDSLELETNLPESPRRFRLFAVACCRRLWHLMSEEPSRTAVEVVERHVEGLASEDDLLAAVTAARVVVINAILSPDFQRLRVTSAPLEGGPGLGGN